MSSSLQPEAPQKENWGSRLGVVLAVAGSAVGLGNFLRFPGQAVNNGGGAFMIPYFISFILLGIPIAWCEWTMGRLGGRYGQNSAPGIMYALWRKPPAKVIGGMTLLIPIVIYMYYILLEAWCLDYCIEFLRGGFAETFSGALEGVEGHATTVTAVTHATSTHWGETFGLGANGALLMDGGRTIWLVLTCFLVNFFIIYWGVARGIEVFCKYAMPALILCAIVILVRVLTLPNIGVGLGFMWNPQWEKLSDPQVWLAASGQIFFSCSVGFGLILCYSSYLRGHEDVVVTSLSASSTNEFCEVILGGMIVVPTAFLFLGAESATAGTFGLGFITVPAIMHFMPGGNFFGAMWFGLLFLAAVTSSLSMLQPAIAFFEDGFGLKRRASVAALGIMTAIGAAFTIYFSRGLIALDHTDFWCNLLMVVAATCQVLIFGWVIGAERGVREMNRGADIRVPAFMAFVIRFVTPTFLLVVLVMWSIDKFPTYLSAMSPREQGDAAVQDTYASATSAGGAMVEVLSSLDSTDTVRADGITGALSAAGYDIAAPEVLAWVTSVRASAPADTANVEGYFLGAIQARFAMPVGLTEDLTTTVVEQLGDESLAAADVGRRLAAQLPGEYAKLGETGLTEWVARVRERATVARELAATDANVARFVFMGVVLFLIFLVALSDIACRNRIRRTVEQAELNGPIGWTGD